MTAIYLKWTPRFAADVYRIYRSANPIDTDNLPAHIAEISGENSSYSDDSADPGLEYYYILAAVVGDPELVAFSRQINITGAGHIEVTPPQAGTFPIAIINGDFETGDLTGWTSDNGDFFVDDGSAYSDGVTSAYAGTWMALTGVTALDAIRQSVTLSDHSTAIDAGYATLNISAFLRCVIDDRGRLGVGFYDVADALIGSETFGAYTNPGSWTEKTLSVPIPANARTAEIIVQGDLEGSGSVCQAYWDEIAASIVISI